MNADLKIALDAIKEDQAKRRMNWENAVDDTGKEVDQDLEVLHLAQLDALKRHIQTIEKGTYQKP